MIRKIITYFYKLWTKVSTLRVIESENPLQTAGKEAHEPTVKECTRDAATKKRVSKAFKEQQQQMQARALKAHEVTCDPLSCDKNVCFKRVPDEIKKRTTVKRRMSRAKAKLACRKKTSE